MIKLMKSTFLDEQQTKQKLADFIMQAKQLSMGEECRAYEKAFAAKQGRKHAIFVSSGSAANLGLLQALLNTGKLKRGARVGFSALTWATNVMPIMQLGMTPVAIDCELDTLNTSPATLAAVGKLDALFLTNVLGLCDDLPGIAAYCQEHGIRLLEDNCESLGSSISGKQLGNYGFASTFSSFVGHHVSTVEGGMVCTDDDDFADAVTMVRAHGWDRNLSTEKQAKLRKQHGVKDFFALYTFYDLAYNLRPTEIQGFLGKLQIAYWDTIVNRRAENFAKFQEAATQNPNIYTHKTSHMDKVSNFAMPVVYKSESAFMKAQKTFADAQVEIRPIIAGSITEQPFYRKYVPNPEPCPNATLVHNQGLYFPNNPELTENEVTQLCNILKQQ
jgi:CDP-6-deoxy-D-xylo-4-hexulose-3-dehydrase